VLPIKWNYLGQRSAGLSAVSSSRRSSTPVPSSERWGLGLEKATEASWPNEKTPSQIRGGRSARLALATAGKYRFARDGHPFHQSNCAREDVIVITISQARNALFSFDAVSIHRSCGFYSEARVLQIDAVRELASIHLRSAFSPAIIAEASGSELVSPGLPRYYAATVARSVAHRQAGIGNILPGVYVPLMAGRDWLLCVTAESGHPCNVTGIRG
jgi:hypothetical protein